MILSKLQEDFTKRYQGDETQARYFSAPVCLTISGSLGAENGGTALILPISMKVSCVMRKRGDDTINLEESDSTMLISYSQADIPVSAKKIYKGELVKKLYAQYGFTSGVDMLFHHDVNMMSNPFADNSAAGICMINAFCALFGNGSDDMHKVRICESAEKEPSHIGAAHKICALRAEKNMISAINCGDLSYKNYAWSLEPHKLVILRGKNNGGGKRKVNSEIKAAVKILKERNPELRSVENLTAEQISVCARSLTAKQKRLMESVIEEQKRISKCKQALMNNDIQLFCDVINSRESIDGEQRDFLNQILSISGIIAAFITDDNDIVCFTADHSVDSVMSQIYKYMKHDFALLLAECGESVHEYVRPQPEAV